MRSVVRLSLMVTPLVHLSVPLKESKTKIKPAVCLRYQSSVCSWQTFGGTRRTVQRRKWELPPNPHPVLTAAIIVGCLPPSLLSSHRSAYEQIICRRAHASAYITQT